MLGELGLVAAGLEGLAGGPVAAGLKLRLGASLSLRT